MRTSLRRAAALMVSSLLLVPAATWAASDEAAGHAGPGSGDARRIAFIIEEGPSSAALRAGAEQAAADRGEIVEVHAVSVDAGRQASILGRRLSVDDLAGLAVAVTDPEALADGIASVMAAGIPVVITHNGLDAWKSLGASAFVGHDESMAGAAAGRRLAELGVAAAICVRDVALDAIQAARCQGAAHELSAADGRLQTLFALDPPGDPTGVRDAITARLVSDPGIDAVLATEEDGLAAAIQARERASRPDVLIATFEQDADVLRHIEAGTIRFAVDQQPFLQGYLSVVVLGLANETATGMGNGAPIITGPRIIETPQSGAPTPDA